jgi:hypothetical protein
MSYVPFFLTASAAGGRDDVVHGEGFDELAVVIDATRIATIVLFMEITLGPQANLRSTGKR